MNTTDNNGNGSNGFASLKLGEPIQKAIAKLGYTHPTPIQSQAIPHVLENKDVLGIAQTGTGKTAAFSLPILQRLLGREKAPENTTPQKPAVLILAPTRELALQIEENIKLFSKEMKLQMATVFGGIPKRKQINNIKRGISLIIATPGRLLDLNQMKILDLSEVQVLVLDEADRMMDMGFTKDMTRIVRKLPKVRQTLFFSATMSPDILQLSQHMLHKPIRVEVSPESTTAEKVDDRVLYTIDNKKRETTLELLEYEDIEDCLIFTRTKIGADKLERFLKGKQKSVLALHGDKTQSARQKALNNFKEGKCKILVATDVASRGIDISNLSCVINYDVPNEPEAYIHRVGRTGRAGKEGRAFTLCTVNDRDFWRKIELLVGHKVKEYHGHSNPMPAKDRDRMDGKIKMLPNRGKPAFRRGLKRRR